MPLAIPGVSRLPLVGKDKLLLQPLDQFLLRLERRCYHPRLRESTSRGRNLKQGNGADKRMARATVK